MGYGEINGNLYHILLFFSGSEKPGLDLSDFGIHLPDFGWFRTKQSLFPYFYENKTSSWLCFSSTDSNRFYRYSDNVWSLVE